MAIAVAYLRLSTSDKTDAQKLEAELRKTAKDRRYTLHQLYQEAPEAGDERTALLALLMAVETRGIHTVLMPSLEHLSFSPDVRQCLMGLISAAGASVVLTEPPPRLSNITSDTP